VSEITDVLGRAGVNIRGFSVSDTADYGIVRLVVDDPDAALKALQDAGFTVKESDVICIDLPDHPGGLAGVLKVVANAGVNIEYVYSLISTTWSSMWSTSTMRLPSQRVSRSRCIAGGDSADLEPSGPAHSRQEVRGCVEEF
jgi:hypothetical protein